MPARRWKWGIARTTTGEHAITYGDEIKRVLPTRKGALRVLRKMSDDELEVGRLERLWGINEQ